MDRISEEIYGLYLDATSKSQFTAEVINEVLRKRLYILLCEAEGQLSAIRHGRKLTDQELEQVYYPLRDICDDLAAK